ncbi:MAG: chromosome segregation protein SMC [Chitinophagaceae bacterium]
MRLKSLEIKGFKSFADKTIIHFDERITGVVGPNGCGKSNIVDSIRWVIGEHKISNLRSENLDGLVFNGSKSRSASGLAEVSLTFENTKNILPTEFTTVTITRKFFKNGESEYRLNDVACRLKDIHNLFMDTGVSTDSYAILEVGMVDDIINDKENSRRRMLEQAAGISIYKTRKREAKLKLDATDADLNRIEDLLFEINNNLKTLESQARKAEKYLEVKRDYQEISVELAKASLVGFNLSYHELTTQQQVETDHKIQTETEIVGLEALVEQDKLHFIIREKELQETQKFFNELVAVIGGRENDKNLATQQLDFLQQKETATRSFLTTAQSQLAGLAESILFSEGQLVEEQGVFDGQGKELEVLQKMVEQKMLLLQQEKQSLDALRKEQQQVQLDQFEAEKKMAVAETSVQNLQNAMIQTQSEKSQREMLITQLELEKTGFQTGLEQEQQILVKQVSHQEMTQKKILAGQQQMEGLRGNLVLENRILDAKRNEHDLLKSLVDNLEGYPESLKFLKKNKDWDQHTPILSDVFFCQEEYRTSVENLLEPYLNYYVVPSVEEGIKAILLLEQHKMGKANFFVLDQMEELPLPSFGTPEGTIPALDVVELEEKYQGLGRLLLGKVFITSDIGAMDRLQFPDPEMVILDKSGRMNRGKYKLGGGSIGLFEGKKLGRVKNLEKLQLEIKGLDEKVLGLQQDIQKKHEEILDFNQELNEYQIRSTRDKISSLQQKVFNLQNRVENFHQLNQVAGNRLLEMEEQLRKNQENIAVVGKDRENLNILLNSLVEKVRLAESGYQQMEQEFNLANVQFNQMNLQHTRQQSKLMSLNQELTFKRKQWADLESQIQINQQQLEDSAANMQVAREKLTQAKEGLVELLRQKEGEEKSLHEKEQEYYRFRNHLSELEGSLRIKQKAKEQIDQQLTAIKDRINDLKLQLAAMKERLNVEFKVNLDDILDAPGNSDFNLEELQVNADKLKKRLENMGEINPTSIEAYQEMKKRYDFILDQKNDLVSAKDSLLETIQEVETTANQKFLETFNQVKENFIKVFQALFSEEDQCDLILSNPEDLPETGIEIIAKPKGKRPAAITQLSGGEKTLTATALLFAIYLIKPAPFCILDEVDAPLDDANVGKFTNMIRKFSDNSQFIIVTHNKQTMASVDIIYGVTMQEPGVSKLVPVDFRSLN